MSGNDLKNWRTNRSLSQIELAILLGVTRQTVINWEKAAVLPRIVKLAIKALASDVDGIRYTRAEVIEMRARPTLPGSKAARSDFNLQRTNN